MFLDDWSDLKDSYTRLVSFTQTRNVTQILGTHVEMSAVAGQVYPYQTTYQPNEHALQLEVADLIELEATMMDNPHSIQLDFVRIDP